MNSIKYNFWVNKFTLVGEKYWEKSRYLDKMNCTLNNLSLRER